jgi:hypothetical protein
MLRIFTRVPLRYGLRWKPGSLQLFLPSTELPRTVMLDVDGEQHEIHLEHRMLVLGAQVASDPTAALDHRLGKTTAVFWKYSMCLKSREIRFEERTLEYRTRVWPVALYSAPAWNLNKRLLQKLIVLNAVTC